MLIKSAYEPILFITGTKDEFIFSNTHEAYMPNTEKDVKLIARTLDSVTIPYLEQITVGFSFFTSTIIFVQKPLFAELANKGTMSEVGR